jgi:VanZ family protein
MRYNLKVARTLAIVFALLIIGGSSVPGRNIPEVFHLTPDKLIHCAEYFVFGFFLFQWINLEFENSNLKSKLLLTIIFGTTMGIVDENYQRLTPGRTPDLWDWVLDAIGVIMLVTIIYFIKRRN